MLTRAVSADEQAQRTQAKDKAIIAPMTTNSNPEQAFSVQESSGA